MDHPCWQHDFVKLYMEYKNKVDEYSQFILDLAQWTEARTPKTPTPWPCRRHNTVNEKHH